MRPHSRTALAGLLLTAVGAAVIACSTGVDEVDSADSEHRAGELLSVNDKHVWAQVSDAEFGKGMNGPSGAADADDIIARQDPTTVRIQQWLDRYHAVVGDVLRVRGETLTAPKPGVAIFKTQTPNAWVSSTFACPSGWSVEPMSVDAGAPGVDAGSSPQFILTPGQGGNVDLKDRCIQPQNWTDRRAFSQFWNNQSPACQLSVLGSGQLGVQGCTMTGVTAPLVTAATSSIIGVTIDALTWGSETTVAKTLAHELGHYYRAHTNTLVKRQIEFFYRDDPNGPDRPVEHEESDELERTVTYVQASPKPILVKSPTTYNKRLAGVVFSLAQMCPAAQVSNRDRQMILAGIITDANSAVYVSFEQAIAACAPSLNLATQETATKWQQILTQQRIRFRAEGATVAEQLGSLTATFDGIDAGEASILERVKTNKLGWYTNEQEADDIGLELASRVGFSPSEVIAANVRFNEQMEALYAQYGVARDPHSTPIATCKKWLADGFMETSPTGVKTPVFVPMGSLSDPHHDGCYRIYNLWREARRHNYVVAARPAALTPAWSEIQTKAGALGGTKPPVVGGPTPGGPGTTSGGPGTTSGGPGTTSGGSNPSSAGGDDDDVFVPVPTGSDDDEAAPPPRKRPTKKPGSSNAPGNAATEPTGSTDEAAESGCSSAPGSAPSSALPFASLLALVMLARRRRAR